MQLVLTLAMAGFIAYLGLDLKYNCGLDVISGEERLGGLNQETSNMQVGGGSHPEARSHLTNDYPLLGTWDFQS